MRICILTQYYPPEIGAPQTRLSHLANALASKKHKVYILTAMPNYPTGKYYNGYSGIINFEKEKHINIIRCCIYSTKSLKIFPRMFSYLSFVVSSLIIGLLYIPKIDYLMVESPPLFLGFSAVLLSKSKASKLIFNVSDLWPDSAVNLDFISDGIILKFLYFLEACFYHKAWMITGQSLEIVQNIKKKFPALHVYHFSNGVDTMEFSPDKSSPKWRKQFFNNKSIIILYAGLHGLAQGLDQIIKAALKIPKTNNISIVFIGDGPEKDHLKLQANQLKLKNVHFFDPLPKKYISGIVASADIAIIPLKKHIIGAVPSKLYEAMGSGLPVILVAEGEPAHIVKQSKCGVVVEPGNIKKITDTMVMLSKNLEKRKLMGKRSRTAALQRFDRNYIAKKFISYLEKSC